MTTQLTEFFTNQLNETITTLLTESSNESYTTLLTEFFTYKLTNSFEQNEDNEGSIKINSSFDGDSCKDNKKIKNSQGKCICDNLNGYYSIKYNNILFSDLCYNTQTKPKNFFLNKESNLFEICYKNCQSCNNYVNDNENNCSSCVSNYIFLPDYNNSTNCVPKCNYYYYYSLYNIYSCTSNFQCPEEAKLLIRNKNRCIDNCSMDNIYKYQYSGECLDKCPDYTNVNGYKCERKNIKSCSLSIFPLNLTFNDLINNNLNSFTKNYVEEFNYTYNQIINFTNKEYSLIIYKNSSCIKDLSLTVPLIDFGKCYEKLKLTYGISDDLVIAVLDKYIENENPINSYLLFNPKNGEKISANEICKNETIIMKENVLTIPGVDPFLVKFFADQNINIFNITDKFYTDICKDYKSPNDKDIPLKLRLQLFFPNISLCDKGCISKGVDIKAMESICYCPFTDISHNSFISNAFEYSETLGEVYSFISNSNFDVLFCIKQVFQYKYFKRCIGGIIIMILFLFQIICVLTYTFKSRNKLKIYIYNLSNSYIKSLKSQINKEPPKKRKKKKNSI